MLHVEVALKRGNFQRQVRLHSDAPVLALIGPSGAGKTSVLHAIAGLITPQSGRIEIEGRVLFDAAQGINLPPHRRHIGYVFQEARLFPHLNVRSNLKYGRHPHHAQPRFDFDAVVDLLGIHALLNRPTGNLSGGEAQRVAIGRALLSQPALLLLDEPLSALDAARRAELIPYLQRLRDQIQLPMLYVSHRIEEIHSLTDAVYALD